MGPIQTLSDLFDMTRRRAGLLLAITGLSAIVSVIFALNQPHIYASSEVLQIERPRITDELAPSTVQGSSARRLQLIEQQLMARDAVLTTIRDHGVFADMPSLTDSEKVALFRESVTITGVVAAREGAVDDGTISALTITAQLGSPEVAQAVAHALGTQTIELSAAARRAQTRATLDFFIGEEQALVQAIAELESEIASFRTRNDLSITGQIEFQQAEMGSLNQAILDVERSRIAVQRELDTLDPAVTRAANQRRIAQLQAQVQTLDEQYAYFQQRAVDMRQALASSPEIERKISIFERRLQQYQDQLELISARRADAEIGNRLEMNRQAERLEILEPAALPDYPLAPSRKKIALLGTVAGAIAAFVLAFLLELRHPVVRSAAQMQRELGILPAISIPLVRQPRARVPLFGRGRPPRRT